MIQISEFSRYPGGSLREQGDFSGQEFREEKLAPVLRDAIKFNGIVVVDLDGTIGLSTSFLREAFGALISKDGFALDDLERHLKFRGDEPSSRVYIDDAWEYIRAAAKVSVH